MLHLKPEILAEVKEILAKHVPHCTVWAYGSRVNGQCHDGSDLDLAVISLDKKRLPNLLELKEALSESNIPILVDVMDFAIIPDSFKEEIERLHVVIQP